VLEQGTRVPLDVWVAAMGHRPAIPPKAKRIGDIRRK